MSIIEGNKHKINSLSLTDLITLRDLLEKEREKLYDKSNAYLGRNYEKWKKAYEEYQSSENKINIILARIKLRISELISEIIGEDYKSL